MITADYEEVLSVKNENTMDLIQVGVFRSMSKSIYIGIDGCKGGWVAAILENDTLHIKPYKTIADLFKDYPKPDVCLIDMAIGLPETDSKVRPDSIARRQLGKKGSSVFPVPSRRAVGVETKNRSIQEIQKEQKCKNGEALGKSLSQQSLAIIPKMKELDEFLEVHAEYREVMLESHPELCFARLKGAVLFSKKSRKAGRDERIDVLKDEKVIDENFNVLAEARQCKDKYDCVCKPDDILDAIVLAVTARLKAQGQCEIIHADMTVSPNPPVDAKGLKMQMVVPKEKRP